MGAYTAIMLWGFIASRSLLSGTTQEPIEQRERVCFSVLDKEDKPILGLAAEDFSLRIGGRRASLEKFQPGADATNKSIPLAVWILIQNHPAVGTTPLERQADAMAAVFEQLHPSSEIGVAVFDDRIRTLAPIGHDAVALREAFLRFGARRSELKVDDIRMAPPGGLARALELTISQLERYLSSRPEPLKQEARRAVLIVLGGGAGANIVDSESSIRDRAIRSRIFLYPVCFPLPDTRTLMSSPRRSDGRIEAPAPVQVDMRDSNMRWYERFREMAQATGGIVSIFGAMSPGVRSSDLSARDSGSNGLIANFRHMVRDLSGKYSFEVLRPAKNRELKLELTSRVKGTRIVLAQSR